MLQFKVEDSQGHKLTQGKSDSPYIVRNALRKFLEYPIHHVNPNELITHSGLRIWCSSELSALMQDTPTVINNQAKEEVRPQQPIITGPSITLKELCRTAKIKPAKARRILRKHFGVRNLKYEWPRHEADAVLQILRKK